VPEERRSLPRLGRAAQACLRRRSAPYPRASRRARLRLDLADMERVTGPTVAWLDFMLDDDAEGKNWFVGSSCTLCGHDAEYEFGQNGLD
jgi:hypothetical protein